jgi:flagellar hook-length control protein FliK
MKYQNIPEDPLYVNQPIVGISMGGMKKLDAQVVEKVISNLAMTPANKRRLKKLETVHGAGFWGDFGKGFKTGLNETLDVAAKVAGVAAIAAPLLAAAGKKSELDKAKDSLKKFVNKERKSMPTQKHLDLLEKHGIISKTQEGGNIFKDVSKGVSKAAKTTVKAASSGAKYVKKHEKDIRKVVKNPIVKSAILAGTAAVAPEFLPVAGLALSAAGKSKRPASKWVVFVKEFAAKNNLKYADALKKAAPAWKAAKGN